MLLYASILCALANPSLAWPNWSLNPAPATVVLYITSGCCFPPVQSSNQQGCRSGSHPHWFKSKQIRQGILLQLLSVQVILLPCMSKVMVQSLTTAVTRTRLHLKLIYRCRLAFVWKQVVFLHISFFICSGVRTNSALIWIEAIQPLPSRTCKAIFKIFKMYETGIDWFVKRRKSQVIGAAPLVASLHRPSQNVAAYSTPSSAKSFTCL